jgi:hypothetical protein
MIFSFAAGSENTDNLLRQSPRLPHPIPTDWEAITTKEKARVLLPLNLLF